MFSFVLVCFSWLDFVDVFVWVCWIVVITGLLLDLVRFALLVGLF